MAILDDRKSLLIAFLDISDQYTTLFFNLFTKWLPAAILDGRKSLSIAFLAISDQYATFFFFSQNGCRWPFWMTEITFDHISRHFKSIRNFYLFFICNFLFSQNGCRRPFLMAENHFRSHFSSFKINKQFLFTKWLPAAILDGRKSLLIAFLAISDQCATFLFLFSQNGCQRPFWMAENHF